MPNVTQITRVPIAMVMKIIFIINIIDPNNSDSDVYGETRSGELRTSL